MRLLALIGVVASLVFAAAAVWETESRATSRRVAQDRALQAAVNAEVALITSGERQADTAAQVLLASPQVGTLIGDPALSGRPRESATRDAASALAAMRSSAFVPVSATCLLNRAGVELACAPRAPRRPLAPALGRQLVALAAGQRQLGAVSNPFISPVTGHMVVAFLVALRSQGQLVGAIHVDVGGAQTRSPQVLVHGSPGVKLALAAYEHGELQLNNQAARLTSGGLSDGATVPLRTITVGERPVSTVQNGHRMMIASLPLRFGVGHESVAVVASATASAPSFLNAWTPDTLALAALAGLIFVVSASKLLSSYRAAARDLARDPLTGLGNRRALMADLQRACRHATDHAPVRLWLFDLNGFKRYNDAFGRAAGDQMLERLADKLGRAVAGFASAYRVGGDELAVIVCGELDDPEGTLERTLAALAEGGGGFQITASAGAVSIPRDTAEPTQALLLADQRMYREKAASRTDATELVTAVLSAALAQRHPDLGEHTSDVAGEVELLARAVGLDGDRLTVAVAAANLHDIGKLGVPDRIITKPGPLNDREWEFIKQHTVIGERIIAAAGLPLEGIGQLVRSSHERCDGTGYPDGLAHEQIPLGARIITICDAFGAMVNERVYKRAMSVEEALAELNRCAGSQFDPVLVKVFCRLVRERTDAPQRLRGAAA